MKRFLIIYFAVVFSCLADVSGLVINESMRLAYGARLTEVVDSIHSSNIMLIDCKKKLSSIAGIFEKDDISSEDYGAVYSDLVGVIPEFLGANKILLDKILVFSLFHLLNIGSYVSIGSSFIPSDEELESITLDETTLTQSEFVRIQNMLNQDAEYGTLDDESFTRALDVVRESRL